MNVTAQKVWFPHEVVNTGDRYIAISLVPGRKRSIPFVFFCCHDWIILYPKNRISFQGKTHRLETLKNCNVEFLT